MDNKKTVTISFVVMIVVFLFLIISSTYAYFVVTSKDSTSKTKASVEVSKIGTGTIISKNGLKLNLTREHMLQNDKTIEYYATVDGIPVTSENLVTIAEVSVTGEETMDCYYKIGLSIDGNLYEAFRSSPSRGMNQVVLSIGDSTLDFGEDFSNQVSGVITNVVPNVSQNILGSLKIVNKHDLDQSFFANKNIIVSFNLLEFYCSL